jgi:rhamnosyltransferase
MISVVVRTYNEEKHLPNLLMAVRTQEVPADVEVVLVDSGSTDQTLAIAEAHGCRILRIDKQHFSFGRSLNVGCDSAAGDILAFVSGHCVPLERTWLHNLIAPVRDGRVAYAYGRQVGNGASRFSECQLFRRNYPERNSIPQEGYFCNNANAAILRSTWADFRFDEELTGLEDMALAQRITSHGGKVGYVADATVYHLHDETWQTIRNRFEREAIALQAIMPQVHISFADFLRYFCSAVLLDFGAALQERKLLRYAGEIVAYRMMQFWGSYRGNNEHRRLSQAMKDRYFYPR